jgi:ABC-type antimicrobial peptide transport system permease subunit
MIKKILASFSLGLIIASCTYSAALAEDATTTTTEEKTEVKSDNTPVKTSKADGGKLAFIGNLPKRLSIFTIDFLVGTPAYIVRKTKQESISGVTDIVGENRNPLLVLPSAALSIPFGIVAGSISGPMYAAANGWRHSDDDHLSKEGFGLVKQEK